MALSESAISGAAARSHLKDSIGAFASHVGQSEGIELSQQSIAAIQASSVNFARNLTSDIEMFARHRGARTVSTADLKMALRKSAALTSSVRVAEAAFAENVMNPQAPQPAAGDGSRKRGRPPKLAATIAGNTVEFESAVAGSSSGVVADAFAQAASDDFAMLPQAPGSARATPAFKPPRSRIVRSPYPRQNPTFSCMCCSCNNILMHVLLLQPTTS